MARTAARIGITLILTTVASACSGWRHGSTVAEYQGLLLRVQSAGPGATRLAIESAYDPILNAFLATNGTPDYIYVADRFSLQLTYVTADRVVLFERPSLSSKSQETITGGVPEGLLMMLEPEHREAIVSRRNRIAP